MAKADYPRNGSSSPEAKATREAHWRPIVERWKQSALTKTEFARREGISPGVLYWWDREIRRRDQRRGGATATRPKQGSPTRRSPGFIPVRVIEARPAAASEAAVEVVTRGGHVIRLKPGFDPATLSRVVAALEGWPC